MSNDRASTSGSPGAPERGPGGFLSRLFTPDGFWSEDRPIHARGQVLFWLFSALALGLMFGFSLFPALVEDLYATHAGPIAARFLAAISSVFPFSLAEALLAALIVWVSWSILRTVFHVLTLQRRLLNALACFVLKTITAALGICLFFYASWGLNYARPDLPARLDWTQTPGTASAEELATVCAELVAAANAAYAEMEAMPKTGASARDRVNEDLDAAYEQVASHLELAPSFALSRGPAKTIFGSWLLCYAGISGFYSPFTGEANYNRLLPPSSIPLTVAHEKAHQRCVTGEDEASFLGYLACLCASEPALRYSGFLFAQEQLLAELSRSASERARELIALRSPGVQRDVEAREAFWRQYEGAAMKVASEVNDTYLKANRVKEGIRSYAHCADLLMTFARMNEGTCIPPGWTKETVSTPLDTAPPARIPEAEAGPAAERAVPSAAEEDIRLPDSGESGGTAP